MKKSANVIIGPVTVGAMIFALAACSDEEYVEVQADSQEICVEQATGNRVPFERCDDDSDHSHYYPWFHSSSHGPAPAVGSRINPAYGSTVRPAGSIARPPATGGFGGSKVSAGT